MLIVCERSDMGYRCLWWGAGPDTTASLGGDIVRYLALMKNSDSVALPTAYPAWRPVG